MTDIPVFSISAWSGTGKTTFLEKLIPELKKRGLRVAVLKHDAHEFEVDAEGKDSWRMTRAGADISMIVSDTHAAYMENRPISVGALLDKVGDVDVILAEGYKNGDFPKIVLYRKAVGKPFPCAFSECAAIVADDAVDAGDTPVFSFSDVSGTADFICERLGRRASETVGAGILAGGKSRRMGADKASLAAGGESFL